VAAEQVLARGEWKDLGRPRAMEIVRSNIRLCPAIDAPPDDPGKNPERLFDPYAVRNELLLFSTRHPHWQVDGDDVRRREFSPDSCRKILIRKSARDLRG